MPSVWLARVKLKISEILRMDVPLTAKILELPVFRALPILAQGRLARFHSPDPRTRCKRHLIAGSSKGSVQSLREFPALLQGRGKMPVILRPCRTSVPSHGAGHHRPTSQQQGGVGPSPAASPIISLPTNFSMALHRASTGSSIINCEDAWFRDAAIRANGAAGFSSAIAGEFHRGFAIHSAVLDHTPLPRCVPSCRFAI
jgi:hypothetical protein